MPPPFTPFQLRRDRLRRWQAAGDAEVEQEQAANRAASAEAVGRSQHLAEQAAGFQEALEASRGPAQDPFFQQTLAEPDVPRPQPLGPPPAGMRPSRRPAAPEPTADPYASESRLARALAQVRYQSPLTPLLGLGQTTAKVFHTVVQRPLAAAFEGPFRGAEQFLDERIKADEAREAAVRELHMSPGERVAQDLARFAAEFETSGRILPILKAVPAARAVPEGASFLAREGASAARLGSRAATEAGQFGAFEAGKSVATGEPIKDASRRTTEGTLAGAIFGAGVPAVGSVAQGILRPVAEGVAAVPGAIRESARRGALNALVAEGMVRDAAGRLVERLRPVRERATAARKPPEAPAGAAPLPVESAPPAQERRAGERRALGSAAEQMADIRRRAATEHVDPASLSDDEVLFAVHGDAYRPSAEPSVAVRVGGRVFTGKDFQEASTKAVRKTRGWPLQDWEYDAIQGGQYPTRRAGDRELPVEMGYETIHGDFVSDAEKATAAAQARADLQARVAQPPLERRQGERRGPPGPLPTAQEARPAEEAVPAPQERAPAFPEKPEGYSAKEQRNRMRRERKGRKQRAQIESQAPGELDKYREVPEGGQATPEPPSRRGGLPEEAYTHGSRTPAAYMHLLNRETALRHQLDAIKEAGGQPPPWLTTQHAEAERALGEAFARGEHVGPERPPVLPPVQVPKRPESGTKAPTPEVEYGQAEPGEDPMHFILNNLSNKTNRRPYVPLTREQIQPAIDAGYVTAKGKLTSKGLSEFTTLRRADHERRIREGDLADQQAEPPKPGIIERVKADDGQEFVLSYREPPIDPTTGNAVGRGGYAVTFVEGGQEGGRQGIATEAEARQVLEGFLKRRAGAAPPPVEVPPVGKQAAPEQIETAFATRVTQLANDPEWGKSATGKALGTEDLQALMGLESALEATGFKVEGGGEFSSRFHELISQMHTGLSGQRADKPAAEYVRILDERLAKAGAGRYDVSRYSNARGDTRPVEQIGLPNDFDLAKWRERDVPSPEDLRGETGWGEQLNLLFRRLETASARATRDADMLEALGAPKDAPGVTRARQAATFFADRKVALEQQAEHAVALAERYHSLAATHRAASLNRDLGQAKIKPSDWAGNRMVIGEWVSDGKILFRRADLDQLPASRRQLYDKRPKEWVASSQPDAERGTAQDLAAKLVKTATGEAKVKLELLGHLPEAESGHSIAKAFLVPEGKEAGLRSVNSALLRRLKEITKFDELRGPTGKGADERAITAYRDGEPVGLIMPIRMPDVAPFSVKQARALAGKTVPPPKRGGGTTTVAGLTVREPLTARTPMEPNYEQPLASASLPAAAVPQMTPPGTAGADVATMRSEIVRKMANILNIPVRIGKFHHKALGIYKIKPEVVRLKVAKDIEVLGHEVGHHIHKLFFGTSARGGLSSQVLRPWVKELKPLAKGVSDQTSAEGLAEFFRRYLTNPAAAKTAAPTFFDYVEQRLAKEFPEVRAMFEEARATYKTYLEATPEARVASNISTKPQKHWSFPDAFRRFLTNVVDDMYDVERAQREIISSALGLDAPPSWRPVARAKWLAEVNRQTRWEENAADLARLVRGSAGQAEHFVKRGTMDYATLQVKGKSLEAILRPVSKQFDEFLHYAVSRRVLELHGRNIETGIRPEDATAVSEQYLGRQHFVRAFEELQTYQQHLLEWLRDAGVLSPDTFERVLKQNEHYLPFYRVLDDETARRAGAGTVFGRIFSPVKRIKGSGKDIINPFESIIKNTYLYTRLAARQRVAQALGRLAERDGAGVWIERLPTPIAVTKLSFGEIEKQLRGILGDRLNLEGLTVPERQALAEELLAVYRPGDYFGKDNIVSVLRGQKRVWYEVDPDLYKAMMALNHEQAGSMTRLLTFPARTLRLGATLALEFIGRNPVRDQLAAFVQSEYGFKPGFDWGRGLFHMIRRDDLFWKWKAAGGERAALLELDRNSLAKSVRAVLGRPPGAGELLKDVVKSPIELLKLLSAAAEDATRIGEFARGVEREGTSRAGLEKAAAASREVSVDFARHGAKTEGIRLITAFWNARIQGYYRLGRAMRDHPIRTSGRVGVAITMPSVLLFYANKDDPEYWAKQQWERDLFWHVKIRGTYYRIPKPFELGVIFGTIPEHILEWAHSHDPKGLQQALTQTLGSELTSLLPIPTTTMPLIENFANWSVFRRQPIVSRTLEDVQPAFQFTEGTSEVSKGLGRMLNISPQKIDNLMFGWTGGLGRLATDLGDIGGQQVGLLPDEPRPSKTAADIPGVRGFVSRPAGRGSEDVERFYEVWGQASQAKRTRDLLNREDRLGELDRFEDTNADLLDRYDELKSYADELAALRHESAETSRDETLTPDERRQAVEELGREMQRIAAEAIERKTPAGVPR